MRVLIADDSELMLQILTLALRKWNYEVTATRDGREAWETFQKAPTPLVITDWTMPEMDGLELVRRIRAADLPNYVYIILLTARSETEDLVAAMDAGADEFIAKPINQSELRVRVREGARIIQLERNLADQNRRLRETQAALVQSEKLAGLGQLAAGMAHEINNPIAFVTNNAAVLQRDFGDLLDLLDRYREALQAAPGMPPAVLAALRQSEDDCDLPWLRENMPELFKRSLEGLSRVREIVSNLRSFARLDEAEFDEVDLHAALRLTVDVLNRELAEKKIVVDYDFVANPLINCHPGKMNQVFHNILLNAVQASESGGKISIRTQASDDGVAVEIEDHGSGISEANLPKIFEPFFTTQPIGRGTGLGLATAYGIVRDHGGDISVRSRVGEGSTFRIQLPRHLTRKDVRR